ncbi:MAG: hypothetical protein GX958_07775 [Desulfitobacterium sp.]|nr:hypothetical protein [Desulfitobacterium sp.]
MAMSREKLHELIDQVPEERLSCLEDMVTLILGNDYRSEDSSICPIALGELYQDQDV